MRFPANYPNRAVRRAVCLNKMNRLPSEWKAYLAAVPTFAAMIKEVGI